MGIIVLILLIWAAVSGVLWSVVKIAAGVALGIFLGGLLLSVGAVLLVRHRFRAWQRGGQRPTGRGFPPPG